MIDCNCILKGVLLCLILYIVVRMINETVSDNTITEFKKMREMQKIDGEIDGEIDREVKEEIRTLEQMAKEEVSLNGNLSGNQVIEKFSNNKKVILFYGSSCPASLNFMSSWNNIKKSVINTDILEVECYQDRESCQRHQIKLLPTLVIYDGKGNEKKLEGNHPYQNVVQELKLFGIQIDELKEGFVVEAINDEIHLEEDNCGSTYFERRQGPEFCALNGNPSGCFDPTSSSNMNSFNSAYDVVGSYLTQYGDNQEQMNECAKKHSHMIREFGLDNPSSLEKIQNYQKEIEEGESRPLIKGTNYKENNKIISAIKHSLTA